MLEDTQVASEVEIPPAFSYDETLAFSQGLRRGVANKLIAGGIPSDKEGVELLLKTLKDMDKTAIDSKRTAIEADNAGSSREIAEAMVELAKLGQNQNIFERRPDGSVPALELGVSDNLPEVDEAKLGEHTFVPGEDHIGVVAETASEFYSRMKDPDDE